jgi:hypothetical protein
LVYLARHLGIGLTLAVIGVAFFASSVGGQDDRGPRGRVFDVINSSGAARTINVAGFPVVAVNNPFFQDWASTGGAA